MMNRRDMLKGMSISGGCMGLGMLPQFGHAATKANTKPKRLIFFLQNQGFESGTCLPKNLDKTQSLKGVHLPKPIAALEPYRDKLNIIYGLHGKHTSPTHSAYFGALGGYRGGDGIGPAAETIDHLISRKLPQTIMPHLCIGFDSLEAMRARPTISTLSASGPGQGIHMYSDPNLLYKTIFGSIANDEIATQYKVDSQILTRVQKMATKKGVGLPSGERQRYDNYLQGFAGMNDLRERLQGASSQLKKFMPEYDSRYSNPEFETDWHDRLLDLGIAALQSGITNVLTVGSGRGQIFGSWKGIGVEEQGHMLGHMPQEGNPIWDKIRHYNCHMLIKLMKSLEAIPEGDGTMMDNTLIVYTSNNADKQHTDGSVWPFMTLGNCSGRIKMGQFVKVEGNRSINSLYMTLLEAIGSPVESFNMSPQFAEKFDDKLGSINELLV